MSFIPMNFIVGKLASLIEHEYGLLSGVRNNIKDLKSELNTMLVFLKGLSSVENPNDGLKLWKKDVRELAYNIEDTVDLFKVQVDHQPGDGIIKRNQRRLTTVWACHYLASKIRRLKARAIEVADRHKRYYAQLTPMVGASASHESRNLAANNVLALEAMVNKIDCVGIEQAKNNVTSWILHKLENPRRRVLSIVGPGGLGKTTLAMQIYRDVELHFDCSAVVIVSQKFDLEAVLRSIVNQIVKDKKRYENHAEMAQAFRDHTKNKRYLIVIDDIWSVEAWEQIKCALHENENDSVILATTRIDTVARICCYHDGCRQYKLKPLDDINAVELFYKRIFGSNECCPEDLKEISHKMIERCGGIPLALISLASVLANKPKERRHWEEVDNALGSYMETNPNMEKLKQVLSLSYSYLPYHLKMCFLYLSIYPEDYEIARSRLIELWIAEGFIVPMHGLTIVETGGKCFDELIDRNMLQPIHIDFEGKVALCRVHDMIFEVILQHSREENFVTIFNNEELALLDNIRRISMQRRLVKRDQIVAESVRTLVVPEYYHIRALHPQLNRFKVLRVLDIRGGKAYSYPLSESLKAICKLALLKYLRIEWDNWDDDGIIFPDEISSLTCLEFLDICQSSIRELPRGLLKLHRLIILHASFCKLPRGYGELLNLQTLTGVVEINDEFRKLRNLRKLSMEYTWIEDDSFITDSDTRLLPFLEELSCDSTYPLVGGVVYQWIATAPQLKLLKLRVKKLESEDMEILSNLPSLHTLNLDVIERSVTTAATRVVCNGKFPTLKYFELTRDTGYNEVWLHTFHREALQQLRELSLGSWFEYGSTLFQGSFAMFHATNNSNARNICLGIRLPSLRKLTLCTRRPFLLNFSEVLPKVEELSIVVLDPERMSYSSEEPASSLVGMENLPGLRSVELQVYDWWGWVKKAVASVRTILEQHPNKPGLKFSGPDGGKAKSVLLCPIRDDEEY